MRLRRRHQGVSEPILLSEEAVSEEGSRKAPGKELIVSSVFFSDKHWTTLVVQLTTMSDFGTRLLTLYQQLTI